MEQWIKRAQAGDQTAFSHIVEHFTGMALAVAYEKLHDSQLAEDAVQEAFQEAFMHLSKLRQPAAFPGWFKTIVHRQSLRIIRRKEYRMLSIHQMDQIAAEQPSLATALEKKELLEMLHNTIEGLPSNMRLALQLFYIQGYSILEVASLLRISAAATRKRLFDARLKLKKTLPVSDFIHVFNDLYKGGEGMLHIVNGDSVADKLKQGGINGDILVWREIYPVGPVFSRMAEPQNRSQRAAFLEQALGIPQAEYLQTQQQELKLRNLLPYKEIVLWFEHDLFDQTMLCFLLHSLASIQLGDTKLSLLCIGSYPGIELFRGLGQLSSAQLRAMSGTWQTIGQSELELGGRMWEAYTSQRLESHLHFLEQDTTALPFVHAAFEAHLSRLPSVSNGLGIIEQTTLEMVMTGFRHPYELFEQVSSQLNILGMGDLEYWYRLSRMSAQPAALLHIRGISEFPNYRQMPPDFQECVISLTELGSKALAGEIDWVELQPLDDWFGGLQRIGSLIPGRWDASSRSVVQV